MRKWRRRGEKDKQEQTLTEVRRGERETREVSQRSEGERNRNKREGRKKFKFPQKGVILKSKKEIQLNPCSI